MVKGTHLVEVFLSDQTICANGSLIDILNQVGNDFIKVSSDCLVSYSKVKEIDEMDRYIILENGVKLKSALRSFENLRTHFMRIEE